MESYLKGKISLHTTLTELPKLTAEDWQLYTSSMNCDEAARILNSTLRAAVNAGGATRATVQKAMDCSMHSLANYGASNSKPRWLLFDILSLIYPGDQS